MRKVEYYSGAADQKGCLLKLEQESEVIRIQV
jgi:hypothetical protein